MMTLRQPPKLTRGDQLNAADQLYALQHIPRPEYWAKIWGDDQGWLRAHRFFTRQGNLVREWGTSYCDGQWLGEGDNSARLREALLEVG